MSKELSHIKSKEAALAAITAIRKEAPEIDEHADVFGKLLEQLAGKAIELGASLYDVERAILLGVAEDARNANLNNLADSLDESGLSTDEFATLITEFGTQQS